MSFTSKKSISLPAMKKTYGMSPAAKSNRSFSNLRIKSANKS